MLTLAWHPTSSGKLGVDSWVWGLAKIFPILFRTLSAIADQIKQMIDPVIPTRVWTVRDSNNLAHTTTSP
jgi:hypothetical protein